MALNNATFTQAIGASSQDMTTGTQPWNNVTNVTGTNPLLNNDADMSKEAADGANFAIACVIMPILVTFGFIGNVLSLIVLSNRMLRSSSTNILLIGLSISDGLFLLSTIIRKSTCIISRFDEVLSYKHFVLTFPSLFYINTCFSRVSTLLVAVMSLERLTAVTFPLKVKVIWTRTRMTFAVASCFLFTFGFLTLIPAQLKIEYSNRGMPYLQNNQFYEDNKYFLDLYNSYITLSLFRWLPKFIVVICNAVIIAFLWKRHIPSDDSVNVSTTTNQAKTQRRVTTMLVTVAMVFFFTMLPGDVFIVASSVFDEFALYAKYNNLFLVLSNVISTFESINASVNVVIYMILNSTFSEVYLRLFCPCLKRTKRLMNGRASLKYEARQQIPRQNDHRIDESSSNNEMNPSGTTNCSVESSPFHIT